MQAEALLTCSCGMRELGVNDRLEQGVGFSWALLRNEFSFLVEGLDIVLFVSLLLPYEQYYIQSLHQERKLIPEQSPEETNLLFQTVINPQPPHSA